MTDSDVTTSAIRPGRLERSPSLRRAAADGRAAERRSGASTDPGGRLVRAEARGCRRGHVRQVPGRPGVGRCQLKRVLRRLSALLRCRRAPRRLGEPELRQGVVKPGRRRRLRCREQWGSKANGIPAGVVDGSAGEKCGRAPSAIGLADRAQAATPSSTTAGVVVPDQRSEDEEPERAVPLRGAAGRIASNMEASLGVPTATSVRTVPARLLEVNRGILNDELARTTRAKVSFTHLIG